MITCYFSFLVDNVDFYKGKKRVNKVDYFTLLIFTPTIILIKMILFRVLLLISLCNK